MLCHYKCFGLKDLFLHSLALYIAMSSDGRTEATTQSEATDSSSRRPRFTPNGCIQNAFIPTQPSLRRAPSSNSWPILYSRADGGSLFKWVRLEVSRARHCHRGLHPAPKNDLIQIVAMNCDDWCISVPKSSQFG